jgi:hypothetical protein
VPFQKRIYAGYVSSGLIPLLQKEQTLVISQKAQFPSLKMTDTGYISENSIPFFKKNRRLLYLRKLNSLLQQEQTLVISQKA